LASGIAADRFLREIRVTAQLHHPNILPVLHSGEDSSRLFFVLPFMDGGTLRDRLDREKQLPVTEVLAIGLTIANALSAAHERNVLHRDVKPENILFTGGQACLSDFGIARAITRSADDSTTTQGFVRGTPAYMSPEQASGEQEYDGRSDLYSLACVLYEALAGIQPFVGPTPQAVIAQRLVHDPRPLRVYRPSASAELEAVLARALQKAPADRYQTARELADALAAVPVNTDTRDAPSRVKSLRAASLIGGSIAIVTALVYAIASNGLPAFSRTPLDTNRVAVIAVSEAPDSTGIRPGDLLQNGLHRWTGLDLVEDFAVADVIRRRGAPRSLSDAREVARAVKAGRYVFARATGRGASATIELGFYDTKSDERLFQRRAPVPTDSLPAFYDALANAIVLRGRQDVAPDAGSRHRNVPATQLFLRARVAVRDWNLRLADSLFAASAAIDPAASTLLWLGQVRAWRSEAFRPDQWRDAAMRATADTLGLSPAERPLAIALRALADTNFARACEAYRDILRRDSSSFAGWYGLAQCHDMDRVVLSDPASPTGYRFRSSYNQAINAYVRAFQLLPSSFGGFADGAFIFFRQKLFTSNRFLRSGRLPNDPGRTFFARPMLQGDTVVFFPAPLGATSTGVSVAATSEAISHLRGVFHRIASGWARAMPDDAGAREARAVSLEVLGEPAAADSFRVIAASMDDPHRRLRLTTQSLIAAVKMAIPADTSVLRRVSASADSIVDTFAPTTRDDFDLLARLAALVGRCDRAAEFSRASAVPIVGNLDASAGLLGERNARLAYAALVCDVPAGWPSLDDLVAQLDLQQSSIEKRVSARVIVFAPVLQATFPVDTQHFRTIPPSTDGLRAQLAWRRGQLAEARSILDAVVKRRAGTMPGDLSPDVALIEARVRLALGDTAHASALLLESLNGARYYLPFSASEGESNLVLIAATVRCMALLGQLPSTDRRPPADWTRAAAILWAPRRRSAK
jgi:hypothetical protein